MGEFAADRIIADLARELPAAVDARQTKVLTSFVSHLRAFVAETRPSEAEWSCAFRFLCDQQPLLRVPLDRSPAIDKVGGIEPHAAPHGAPVPGDASAAPHVPPPKRTGPAPWPPRSRP
jgi:hypothetical protein